MTSEQKSDIDKDDIYFRICNSVLKLELSAGHLKWKLSEIARDADVTRSLIYYYFGKEKKTILKEACRFMLSFIFTEEFMESDDSMERYKNNINKLKQMPYLLVHFFLQKNQNTELGEEIRRAEKAHFQRQLLRYPKNNIDDIHRVYAAQLGILFYQRFTDEEVHKILDPIFYDLSEVVIPSKD